MLATVRSIVLVPICLLISILFGIAFAQEKTISENGRELDKQEIINLISNKAISYHITVGGPVNTSNAQLLMKITFKKTEESGGSLSAFAPGSSTDGKWHVNDQSRLVRQYDSPKWGNKPFAASVVEKSGKYFLKLGEVYQ